MEKLEHAIARLELRLGELNTFKLVKRFNLDEWLFSTDKSTWKTIHIGEKWTTQSFPCYFKKEFSIPEEFKGLPVRLQIWVEGEGIVYINDKPVGGLDPNHREFRLLDSASGGEKFSILIEAVPRGPFGSYVADPHLAQSRLVSIDESVESAIFDIYAVLDAAKNLSDENELKEILVEALDNALSLVVFPSETESYLTSVTENPFGSRMVFRVWNPPVPKGDFVSPEETRKSLVSAQKKLQELLEEIKDQYPPVGNITLTGHSHIDLAWLWPMAETRRKIRRTSSSVISLMNKYSDFKYNQSSAQIYAFLKEDEPYLYEKAKERIKAGQWEPIGGMWVESDCNLTSGESLVRQMLYAQKFFEKEFGRRCSVAWLPDAFGFTWTLPQLFKKAGIDYFLTTKINWNETNKFPYDLFYWQGLDGTRIIAHSFLNPGQGYNGNIQALDILGTWKNYRQKAVFPDTLLSFGFGDGGGGPTLEMLEMYQRFKEFPGFPRLKMGSIEEFFARVPKDNLPVWDGELYLELHRGTYTTQSRMKKSNRKVEHTLYTAEVLASINYLLTGKYPQDILTTGWHKLLRNQFHDILPGSSIKEVYQDALRELKEVEDSADEIIKDSLKSIATRVKADREGFIIFNPSSFPRALEYIIEDDTDAVELPDGKVIKTQVTSGGKRLVYSPEVKVPPMGYVVLYKSEKTSSSNKTITSGNVLENNLVRVEIGEDGTILSYYDKVNGREVFTSRGNQLWAYSDRPRNWDAWDIAADYEKYGEEIRDVEYIKILEEGPARGVIEVKKRYRNSSIIQRYVLYKDSPKLDIETIIDWHDRRILVKALFPFDVRSSYATYEIAYGHIQRPTHKNTSWDSAKFEVPGHRWVDISEGNYGVSILNDGKYGYSANESTIGLSLLRSPIYPDFFADEGEQSFVYSILPHRNDWREGTVYEAISLNTPLVGIPLSDAGGKDNLEKSFLEIDARNIVTGAFKKAEDDGSLVLRLCELYGYRGKAKIKFGFDVKKAVETNLLEDELTPIDVNSNEIEVSFKPYEVKTIKLVI
ncbi:MAG TPA: alpha-mannosidase [bacterium]|nr:alpha-mannosidase [bacterium]HOL55087.1 alpha-mannosidase [bacterium]